MKLSRSSMLYGTLLLTGVSLVSQVLGFVYRILLSRLVGAEFMGLYQLVMPVYSVLPGKAKYSRETDSEPVP